MQLTLFDYQALDAETRSVVQQRTTEIRALMKRAAQDILDIGQKLLDVKTRLGHGYFGAWLAAEFQWSDQTALRFMQVAEQFKNNNLLDLNVAPSALYLLARPSTPEPARQEAVARAEAGEPITYRAARAITDQHRQDTPPFSPMPASDADDEEEYETRVLPDDAAPGLRQAVDAFYANDNKEVYHPDIDRFWPDVHVGFSDFGTPVDAEGLTNEQRFAQHALEDDALDAGLSIEVRPFAPDPAPAYSMMPVMSSSASPEWYTPKHILDAVIAVLGHIVLDPCSNPEPYNVPASYHYTADMDGLTQFWIAETVFMNPPYGDEIGQWVSRLVLAYEAGEVGAAIALVPGRIDTQWFQALYAYPLCNIRGRLRFSDAGSAPFPSVLAYLGPDRARFIEVCRALGPIVQRIDEAL